MNWAGAANTAEIRSERQPQEARRQQDLSRRFPGGGVWENPPAGAKPVPKKSLINRINHVHFTKSSIQVCMQTKTSDELFVFKATPQPCSGDALSCGWSADPAMMRPSSDWTVSSLTIDDGHTLLAVPVAHGSVHAGGFTVRLPEVAYDLGPSQVRRRPCACIRAELVQGGVSAVGELVGYTADRFLIRPGRESAAAGRWFSDQLPAAISLRLDETLIFSNRNLRICRNAEEELLEVLLNGSEDAPRGEEKDARNPLRQLIPAPILTLHHPLTGKAHRFRVIQISTSALVVEEEAAEAVLFPGMEISEATIAFAGGMKSDCSVRVACRNEKDERTFTCHLDLVDMGIGAYDRLARLLINTFDPEACEVSESESDGLWEFMFDTGFIYPKKYGQLHPYVDEIRKTLRKICQRPELAAHFTSRNGSRFQAHISMVRAYEQSWMIHHHAARGADSRRSGISVLKQIMFYLNDMHRFPSTEMTYAMAFFRPENRFPDHIFGGFTRYLKDPAGCSLDMLAYLPYTGLSLDIDLPAGWELREAKSSDLEALNQSYSSHSGGLMLKAMGLCGDSSGNGSLTEVYRRFDLNRHSVPYSLSFEGQARAVLLVDRSDLGLNLSELLNNIKILIIDPERLPWRVLSTAVSKLARLFPMKRVPVLFHPFSYVEEQGIPYEKQYQAWVLDVRHGDAYMKYMREKYRIRYK